jgi:hypothetical protein
MIQKYIARRRRKGSFLIEMALTSWVLIYMLIGSFQMGMMLVRAIQAGSVCSNGNVLEVRGVDMSQSQNQQLLLRTAPMLGINTAGAWTPNSSGAGLITLSQVYYVGALECSQGITNWNGQSSTCPNWHQYVIAMRINIGNTAQGTSVVGNPTDTPATGNKGFLTDAQICNDSGDIAASGFSGIVTLTDDQYTWVAEVWANSSAFNFFSWFAAPTIYMRNVS